MQIKEPKQPQIKSVNLFRTPNRFLRSTQLERDWNDPSSLENYVFTPHAEQSIRRIATGFTRSSSLRAWRITGDYGSGKSSFALLLANLFAKRTKHLPITLRSHIQKAIPTLLKRNQPELIPILITGSRVSLGKTILKALLLTLKEYKVHGTFYFKLEQLLNSEELVDDSQVVDWIKRSHSHIVKTKKADGIFLVLDEAGKFLEYAAFLPDKQDVYLLQSLAELAARSGPDPLYILSIFHQGISAYAENLTKAQQREWEKVAGRYEEIIWHFPVEQNVTLITSSLQTQIDNVPKPKLALMRKDMDQVLKLGWYGWNVNKEELQDASMNLYPIHPTVIPVLVRLFSKFGQNERSLYSFLLGSEPCGLQEFVWRTEGKNIFHLYHLYDYARNTFGTRLGNLSYHWKAIDGLICTYKEEGASLHLLKAIGIINLINADDLVASEPILSIVLGEEASKLLSQLQKNHIIHYRGREGGYCVWPNASVNLEDAYLQAKKVLGASREVKSLLKQRLEIRPIVARRHYIETGNLRFFEVHYIDVDELEQRLVTPFLSDGQILVPLCETLQDIQIAVQLAQSIDPQRYLNTLIAVPEPLQSLSAYLDEVRRWEWVERSVGELRQDRFAREEVSRQLNVARQELHKHLQIAVGLVSVDYESRVQWYYRGQQVQNLHSSRDVMALLTMVSNETYPLSPRIHNELINRRQLSSAGAAARLRLCERLFEFADEPYLGMDLQKRPPEMSMYLSVLQEAGIHTKVEGTDFRNVQLPDSEYDKQHCRLLPAMQSIHNVLLRHRDQRVPVLKVFDTLRAAPYGVRDGMIPLLLAVFAVIHEQELAFYEDGSFIPRVTGSNYLRLIKAPETFELQYYPITGIRNTLFHRLIHELGFSSEKKEAIELLDAVKPLLVFMGSLPEYVLKTSHLQSQSLAVRSILLTTTDPVKLLFEDLPIACSVLPITHQQEINSQEVTEFVNRLKLAVDDLRSAYPALLGYIQKCLEQEFNWEGNFDKNRIELGTRAKNLSSFITEIQLKSFCLRLADISLPKDLWLQSLGNILCSMPPSKWKDRDRDKFEEELHKLSNQFKRVEAIFYNRSEKIEVNNSVRVALTRPNGDEREQVIHLSSEQLEKVQQLEQTIAGLLSLHGQVGMAAASRVLWQMMSGSTFDGF